MIWRSTLLNTFKEISHGFVSKPFSFPFMFKLTYLPSYVSFFSLIKVPPNKWVIADQVHGTSIYIVGKEKNKIWPLIAYKTDALITQERKRPLIMFFADCIPIFIYVPRLKIVGIIHSGWRGTIRDFPLKALTFLISNYNLHSKDIYLGIGPSIHSCCFEVKEDFISQLPKDYYKFLLRKEGKFTYDLIGLLLQQIKEAGVPEENIEISHTCTYCSKGFFSFRRDRDINRNVGYIYLK